MPPEKPTVLVRSCLPLHTSAESGAAAVSEQRRRAWPFRAPEEREHRRARSSHGPVRCAQRADEASPGNVTTVRENTVSHALGHRQVKRIVVPTAIFDMVKVFDNMASVFMRR